eukprot:4566949-Alexandrium_andersonii.AAC.1
MCIRDRRMDCGVRRQGSGIPAASATSTHSCLRAARGLRELAEQAAFENEASASARAPGALAREMAASREPRPYE